MPSRDTFNTIQNKEENAERNGAHQEQQHEQTLEAAASIRTPDELNLSQGLAGSLIDSIVEARICDDHARNGVNLEEN